MHLPRPGDCFAFKVGWSLVVSIALKKNTKKTCIRYLKGLSLRAFLSIPLIFLVMSTADFVESNSGGHFSRKCHFCGLTPLVHQNEFLNPGLIFLGNFRSHSCCSCFNCDRMAIIEGGSTPKSTIWHDKDASSQPEHLQNLREKTTQGACSIIARYYILLPFITLKYTYPLWNTWPRCKL